MLEYNFIKQRSLIHKHELRKNMRKVLIGLTFNRIQSIEDYDEKPQITVCKPPLLPQIIKQRRISKEETKTYLEFESH